MEGLTQEDSKLSQPAAYCEVSSFTLLIPKFDKLLFSFWFLRFQECSKRIRLFCRCFCVFLLDSQSGVKVDKGHGVLLPDHNCFIDVNVVSCCWGDLTVKHERLQRESTESKMASFPCPLSFLNLHWSDLTTSWQVKRLHTKQLSRGWRSPCQLLHPRQCRWRKGDHN